MAGDLSAALSAALAKARTRFTAAKPPGSPRLPVPRARGGFNATGRAGPRRLAFLVFGGAGLVGLVIIVMTTGQREPTLSRDARLGEINKLPGGLYSTPEQDALALRANDTLAQAATKRGVSFTPPMAPSQLISPLLKVTQADPQEFMLPEPGAPPADPPTMAPPVVLPHPKRPTLPAPLNPVVVPAALREPTRAPRDVPTAEPPRAIDVAAPGPDPQAQAAYTAQIRSMFSQWDGHGPKTDIVLPPAQQDEPRDPSGYGADSGPGRERGPGGASRGQAALPVSSRGEGAGRILVPTGRGIYAHPVLAVNSDASSPVVLEADSGPLAGDRMIGTFAKQQDRLVIHIGTVIHNGESIGVEGLVIAPDTMEAGVATSIDQHYLERFVLPAAAAFVQGLGAALATTSNTATVLGPLGGASALTQLNFPQQLGVAAGTAAGQVGSVLNQSAPKGPTVSLEANVAVGVMFLANVTSHGER